LLKHFPSQNDIHGVILGEGVIIGELDGVKVVVKIGGWVTVADAACVGDLVWPVIF